MRSVAIAVLAALVAGCSDRPAPSGTPAAVETWLEVDVGVPSSVWTQVTVTAGGETFQVIEDEDGALRVRDIAPGPYDLLATQLDPCTREHRIGAARVVAAPGPNRVSLRLEPAARIVGRLHLPPPGHPGGVQVEAFLPAWSHPVARTETDGEGRFELSLPPGTSRLTAFADRDSWVDWSRGERTVAVVAGETAQVELQVEVAREVSIICPAPFEEPLEVTAAGVAHVSLYADDGGRTIRVAHLRADDEPVVTVRGRATGAQVRVRGGGRFVAPLEPFGVLEVQVIDPEGDPCPGREAWVAPADVDSAVSATRLGRSFDGGRWVTDVPGRACETTDAQGMARFVDLAPGDYAVGCDGADTVELTLRADTTKQVALRVTP
jgi:hypothetical protein